MVKVGSAPTLPSSFLSITLLDNIWRLWNQQNKCYRPVVLYVKPLRQGSLDFRTWASDVMYATEYPQQRLRWHLVIRHINILVMRHMDSHNEEAKTINSLLSIEVRFLQPKELWKTISLPEIYGVCNCEKGIMTSIICILLIRKHKSIGVKWHVQCDTETKSPFFPLVLDSTKMG